MFIEALDILIVIQIVLSHSTLDISKLYPMLYIDFVHNSCLLYEPNNLLLLLTLDLHGREPLQSFKFHLCLLNGQFFCFLPAEDSMLL